MDFLSGFNGEALTNLAWGAAIVAAVLLALWRYWRVDLTALGSVLVFGFANAVAAVYVLFHLGEGRWGGDAHERLVAPSLAGIPMVGQFLEPIDGLLSGLADGVNEFNNVQAALPVAGGFLASAGWAFALAVPLCVVAMVVSFVEEWRRRRAFTRVTQQVHELTAEVAELKRLVGDPVRV
ncbi:hypothetical protein [Sinomonas flava]|uniref:hypothetical protein n=1 Tax=Sinomonas flava TaxID=496857 RepID=UPI0031D43DDD